MGDYTNMSAYYDAIMTSGYYDYQAIVDSLIGHEPIEDVLEIGCGTGLILEEIAKRQPHADIAGIDLTESMLSIAKKRLRQFTNVHLSRQNITQLRLAQDYRLAFSYGGVWYFVIDGDNEPFLVSHIVAEAGNHQGFASLARYVRPGGTLLLGIQGPHFDYEKPISNGMVYSQKIEPHDQGFTKHYYLTDAAETVMAQTVKYRTYNFTDARELLASHGFDYVPNHQPGHRFLQFTKS